jgi:hypothetical protein
MIEPIGLFVRSEFRIDAEYVTDANGFRVIVAAWSVCLRQIWDLEE